ncbi:hypothetical protein MSPP1_003040 [Malassezia sp. CBS 17886]|nr:hypothetical protein MSPP1_003040 [Malassezia sp. CBS 17886]
MNTFISLAICALCASLVVRAAIPTPDNDPFYHPPDAWQEKQPGEILRSRAVDVAWLGIDPLDLDAYQLLYRTSDSSSKKKMTSVTTVLVPPHAKKDQLVSYQTYIDAAGVQCAPSYNLRLGSELGTDLAFQYQSLLMQTLLQRGHIVTVPDYQGLNEAFGAGRREGHMTIDAIRATLAFPKIPLSKTSKVVGYGYSGGGIATGWAASLQPKYAPELKKNVVGWSSGGTPSNVTSTMLQLNGTFLSGFAIAGFAGVLNAYPEISEWAQPRLTDAGRSAIQFGDKHCVVDMLLNFAFAPALSDVYMHGGEHMLSSGPVKPVLETLVMGVHRNETPTAPYYMFHGSHDEAIPYGSARKTARSWTNFGADVSFLTTTDVYEEHLITELTNVPNVVLFVEDRFGGKPFPKGLHLESTSNPLSDPRIAAAGLEDLVGVIRGLIAKDVGHKDAVVKHKIATGHAQRTREGKIASPESSRGHTLHRGASSSHRSAHGSHTAHSSAPSARSAAHT